MWPELILKAKRGGLNVIQTYVFWNIHEPEQGKVRDQSCDQYLDRLFFCLQLAFVGLILIYVCYCSLTLKGHMTWWSSSRLLGRMVCLQPSGLDHSSRLNGTMGMIQLRVFFLLIISYFILLHQFICISLTHCFQCDLLEDFHIGWERFQTSYSVPTTHPSRY